MNDLALPFAEKVCQHLDLADRQGTSLTSTPLKACRSFNAGDITKNQLTDKIAKFGFVNVIDAFHVLRDYQTGFRFFHDDRKGSSKGIILTDELHALVTEQDSEILDAEVDGRWRLVETAWELGIGSHHLEVDDVSQDIFVTESHRRRSVTSVRQALNGYQKGQCFYCGQTLNWTEAKTSSALEVDHFYPWSLSRYDFQNLNGIWNLVLACHDCNAGVGGKFAELAGLEYLERLSRRNDYLIESHHPLRETLMNQTGKTSKLRHDFLQTLDASAVRTLGVMRHQRWETEPKDRLRF